MDNKTTTMLIASILSILMFFGITADTLLNSPVWLPYLQSLLVGLGAVILLYGVIILSRRAVKEGLEKYQQEINSSIKQQIKKANIEGLENIKRDYNEWKNEQGESSDIRNRNHHMLIQIFKYVIFPSVIKIGIKDEGDKEEIARNLYTVWQTWSRVDEKYKKEFEQLITIPEELKKEMKKILDQEKRDYPDFIS